MNHPDAMNESAVLLLLGFAGVAATFAGFSAAVTVFGRRHEGHWYPEERFRLRVLLANALAACFFSFLPLVLDQSGLSTSAGLGIDSALLGVFCVVVLVLVPLARLSGARSPRISADCLRCWPWPAASSRFSC